MSHTRHVDTDGNLVTNISGVVNIDEIVGLQNDLCNYVRNGAIYELIIHDHGVSMNLDSKDAVTSADNLKRVMQKITKGALAFVSDEDFVFGLCRQLQIRVDNDFIQMCVFRTEDTARTWLNEMRSLNMAKQETG